MLDNNYPMFTRKLPNKHIVSLSSWQMILSMGWYVSHIQLHLSERGPACEEAENGMGQCDKNPKPSVGITISLAHGDYRHRRISYG